MFAFTSPFFSKRLLLVGVVNQREVNTALFGAFSKIPWECMMFRDCDTDTSVF